MTDELIYDVPLSIDRTGASDVTVQMQVWLRGLPEGSVIRFPPKARYRIDGTV